MTKGRCHPELGTRLLAASEEVLRRWEQRVCEQLPAARWQSRSELLNHLPTFLRSLAYELTHCEPAPDGRRARPHGEQRAALVEYSLTQVLTEYRLLRQVLFEVLEADDRPLPADARDVVLEFLEKSMTTAADRYDQLTRERESEAHALALRREQSLRGEAERRAAELDAIIESMPEAVLISDLERVVRVNRAALESMQFDSLDELNRHFTQLREIFDIRGVDTGERLPRESMPMYRALRGKEAQVEFTYLTRRTKEKRTALLRSTPVREAGEVTGAVIMQVDVTDRARQARRLEALQEITEAALARSTSRQAVLDSAVTLIQQAFGSSIVLALLLDPRQLPVIEAAAGVRLPLPLPTRFPDPVRALIARNQPTLVSDVEEEPIFRERMRELNVRAFAAAPLRRRDLRLGLVVVAYESPTRLHSDDLALLQVSADQLTIALENAGLYERLQTQVKELETERFIREQFVATVTHDLRGPLTAAQLSARHILRKPNEPDHHAGQASRIIDTLGRIDRMIRDLLDAHTLRAGYKPAMEVTEFDLARELTAACEDFSTVHGQPYRLEADDCTGWWGREAIRRIVENLLSNAAKYGAPHAPVEVSLRCRPHEVRLEVTNQLAGEPLSPADQASLFEPFMRTIEARASGREGWGLGLPLVRGLVVAQGGTVGVISTRERGTTFIVTLPRDVRPFVV